jgi:hypothetical protein
MGKQIAVNTTMHIHIELYENSEGEFQPIIKGERSALIKKEYHPIGKSFLFPKKWGVKKGAHILLEHLIEDDKRIIASSTHRLERLEKSLEEVNLWSD